MVYEISYPCISRQPSDLVYVTLRVVFVLFKTLEHKLGLYNENNWVMGEHKKQTQKYQYYHATYLYCITAVAVTSYT